MNKLMSLKIAAALAAALGVLASTPTLAGDALATSVQVPGQKIDSGLGDLPHYSQWAKPANKVSGEKVDSGLGDLPHYSKWADPTGKNPTLAKADDKPTQRQAVQVSQAK